MLSIVIPTLNAEPHLAQTLDSIAAYSWEDVEIVVVDDGSTDRTMAIAQTYGARVLHCPPGRGCQLAVGANGAHGPWLLFLHADTDLPADWDMVVGRFMRENREELAAYFRLSFCTDAPGARRVAALANWRARTLGLPYGDQGLLVHKTLYDHLGGYRAEQNLMEDVDLVRRIGPMRLKQLNASVTTSAARYERDGWWNRPLQNLTCLTLYLLGAKQSWIERLYK